MTTPATPTCTAITKKGTTCGKSWGTTPTADGPRCYTHLAKDKRRADPGSRCPVKHPKTPEDVQKIVSWALTRAAEGKLSAPAANSVSSMAKTWLRTYSDTLRPIFAVFQNIHEDMMTLLQMSRAKTGCETKYQDALRRVGVQVERLNTLMGGGTPDDEKQPPADQEHLDTDADPEQGDFDVS